MSGGIRPKGSKSYAATRSPEAAEAYRQDQAAQKTLDADRNLCPKCRSDLTVPHSCKTEESEDGQTTILCVNCGAFITTFRRPEENVGAPVGTDHGPMNLVNRAKEGKGR